MLFDVVNFEADGNLRERHGVADLGLDVKS